MTNLRRVTDADALKALAHPTRLRLLYEVGLRDSLTATEAAAIIGGTPAAAAYHLRTLGKYGYLVEAGGGGGRERPWRIGETGLTFNEDSDDPAERAAAVALVDAVQARWLEAAKRYRERARQYPADVREVSGASEYILMGTTDELAGLQRRIWELVEPFIPRITDPALRPEGSVPFEMVTYTHPLSEPPAPASEPEAESEAESEAGPAAPEA